MAGEEPPSLAAFVRQRRLRAGLTQEALAEQAGLSADSVGALERGRRRRLYPHTLRALADALRLTEAERAELADLAEGSHPDPTPRPAGAVTASAPATPPASAAPAGQLPAPLSSFVGRERELTAAGLLLAQGVRLLTLTGPGGAGKTRLAVEAVRAVGRHFPAGVCFVDLAPLGAAALVPQTVATVLGVRDAPGRSLTQGIVTALRGEAALLVLDNCEHLLDACAALVVTLLRECPHLTIVTTSREPLGVSGEQVYAVPPLALPPADWTPPSAEPAAPAALAEFAAVRLFFDRARAAQADFALTTANARAVAEVCRRLDGLPLAIELAAARVRVLSPDQIAARLGDRFRLVAAGPRDALSRHQTLRALIDWSYDLLSTPERALLRRLSVFAGGFSLEAAEAVCDLTPQPPSLKGRGLGGLGDVLDLLTALVDKSLVVVEPHEDASRYLLLESIREYAAEKLAQAGETELLRGHHALYYLEWSERIAPELRGPNQVVWLRRLDAEHNNLRAALHYAEETGDTDAGARLCLALTWFWQGRGYLSEGRAWFAAALRPPRSGTLSPLVRSRLLLGAGELAHWQELAESVDLLSEAARLARAQGEQAVLAEALVWLSGAYRRQRAFTEAQQSIEEGMALYRSLDDAAGLALAEVELGILLSNEGDYTGAVPWLSRALDRFLAAGDVRWIAITRVLFGMCLLWTDDDLDHTGRILHTGLLELHEIGERTFMITGLLALARHAAMCSDPVRAATLLGAADALSDAIGVVWTQVNTDTDQSVLDLIRGSLDEPAIAAARAEGRRLSLETALTEADAARAYAPPS